MYKYEAIANDLEKKITDGVYKADDKLPQEKELCQIYDTSRITIREAMNLLVNRGLISKKRGSGTFVKALPEGNVFSSQGISKSGQFGGFTNDHPNQKITSKIFDFGLVKASDTVAKNLQLPEGSFVSYICRMRLLNDKPQVIEYTYMPVEYVRGLTEDKLEQSIYNHLENNLNLKISSAHRTVRADVPTSEEAERLQMNDCPQAILEVEQVAYLDNGQIFEYSISRHRCDAFELKTVSVR